MVMAPQRNYGARGHFIGTGERIDSAVSAIPCSSCQHKVVGKLCGVYSAWFNLSGEREAFKQRLCVSCATTLMAPLWEHPQEDSELLTRCPLCGSDSSTDLAPTYLSVYLPNREPLEYALSTCESCALPFRQLLQVGSTKLESRDAGSGGLGPRTPRPDPWAGVGPQPT